jgi:hypothetical protein
MMREGGTKLDQQFPFLSPLLYTLREGKREGFLFCRMSRSTEFSAHNRKYKTGIKDILRFEYALHIYQS